MNRALHESCIQLPSQRMELYQAEQLTDQFQRERSWLCTELDRREKALQEDRMKSLQEMHELRKMCCTEAERAKQDLLAGPQKCGLCQLTQKINSCQKEGDHRVPRGPDRGRRNVSRVYPSLLARESPATPHRTSGRAGVHHWQIQCMRVLQYSSKDFSTGAWRWLCGGWLCRISQMAGT